MTFEIGFCLELLEMDLYSTQFFVCFFVVVAVLLPLPFRHVSRVWLGVKEKTSVDQTGNGKREGICVVRATRLVSFCACPLLGSSIYVVMCKFNRPT